MHMDLCGYIHRVALGEDPGIMRSMESLQQILASVTSAWDNRNGRFTGKSYEDRKHSAILLKHLVTRVVSGDEPAPVHTYPGYALNMYTVQHHPDVGHGDGDYNYEIVFEPHQVTYTIDWAAWTEDAKIENLKTRTIPI